MAEFTRRRGYEGDSVEAGEEEDEEEGLFLYHDGSDDDFTREDDAQDCYRPLADGGDDDGDDGDDGDGFDAFDGEVQQQAKEEQELELLRSVREGRSQTNAGSSQQQQQQQRQQHRDTYKVATFGQSVASHEPAVSLMPMRRTTPGVPQLPSSMLLAPSCGIQSLVSAPAGAEAGGTPPLASSRSGSRQFLLPELNESAERRSPLVDSTLEDMRAALQLNQEYQLFIREQLRRIEAAQLRNQELQVCLAHCIVHHSTPCLTRSLAFSLSLSLSLSLSREYRKYCDRYRLKSPRLASQRRSPTLPSSSTPSARRYAPTCFPASLHGSRLVSRALPCAVSRTMSNRYRAGSTTEC